MTRVLIRFAVAGTADLIAYYADWLYVVSDEMGNVARNHLK